MTLWFVADQGRVLGPLLEISIIESLQTGRFAGSSQVWRHGLVGWEPIGAHFTSHRANSGNGADGASTGAAPSEQVGLPSLKARWLPILWAALIAATFYGVQDGLLDLVAPSWLAAIWASAILVVLSLGLLAVIRWWRYATQRAGKSQAPHRWGMIKLASALMGLALIGGGIFASSIATIVYRVAVARQAFDGYTINVNAAQDTIVIDGAIGPRFARRLHTVLTSQPQIHRIEITSRGGLVDEGLKAAAAIEAHTGLTVIARKQCASTCILVLLAGTKTYADWDMMLGFHATSPILSDPDAIMVASVQKESLQSDQYLRDHKVPNKIIDDMHERGPASPLSVPAIQLRESGVLTGLLDRQAEVPALRAKWMTVEAITRQKLPAVADTLHIIGLDAEFVVQKHADALYGSVLSGDLAHVKTESQAMFGELLPAAMAAAADGPVYAYMESNLSQVTRYAAIGDWAACRDYLEGRARISPDSMPPALLEREMGAMVEVIKSAHESAWRVTAPPGWTKDEVDKLLSQAATASAADKVHFTSHGTADMSARDFCILTKDVLEAIRAEGPERGAVATRWLLRKE